MNLIARVSPSRSQIDRVMTVNTACTLRETQNQERINARLRLNRRSGGGKNVSQTKRAACVCFNSCTNRKRQQAKPLIVTRSFQGQGRESMGFYPK
ncbi:MAG: hypothetical protein CME32_28730 [Gimesia sp.]|nr:hypothetical protein [Gimesia sp.]